MIHVWYLYLHLPQKPLEMLAYLLRCTKKSHNLVGKNSSADPMANGYEPITAWNAMFSPGVSSKAFGSTKTVPAPQVATTSGHFSVCRAMAKGCAKGSCQGWGESDLLPGEESPWGIAVTFLGWLVKWPF